MALPNNGVLGVVLVAAIVLVMTLRSEQKLDIVTKIKTMYIGDCLDSIWDSGVSTKHPVFCTDQRCYPDFVFIGSSKCGTTTMAELLTFHPKVSLQPRLFYGLTRYSFSFCCPMTSHIFSIRSTQQRTSTYELVIFVCWLQHYNFSEASR